jgi:hypothetical protein
MENLVPLLLVDIILYLNAFIVGIVAINLTEIKIGVKIILSVLVK